MRVVLRILAVVVAVAVVLVGAIAFLVWRSAEPTSGAPIAKYAEPKTAVLVVDVQEDFTGPEAVRPYADAGSLVSIIDGLLGRAESVRAPVVLIRNIVKNPVQRMLMGGVGEPGSPGSEIDRRLRRPDGSAVFDKDRGDAFSNRELDAWLRERAVSRLVIVGLDGRWCVNSTARGALNRGYEVVMVPDAIATADGNLQELAAGWQAEGAKVVPAAEVVF